MSNLHNLATRTTDCLTLTSSSVATTTGVTMHCIKGNLVRASLTGANTTANETHDFTLTNNRIGPDSVLVVNVVSLTGATNAHLYKVAVSTSGGSAVIGIQQTTNVALTGYTLNFYVLNPVCSR